MLRDYQTRALADVARKQANPSTPRVCLVAPTGAGKSVMGREWCSRQQGPGLILAHRLELLEQFRAHLQETGIPSGIIAPGYSYEPYARVQCASLDTLVARGMRPPAAWVMWDECHHSQADTWRPILDDYPGIPLLGLTATPQRSDGKPLGDVFQDLVIAASYPELVRAGHLVACRVFRPERYLGSDIAWDPADAWMQRSQGKRGFAFCRSVKAAKELATKLTELGEPAMCVDGKMSADKRARALQDFRAGRLKVLTNVHVLTEGLDVPDAEVCMLASGTSHAGTYLQRVGRVLRPSPGKDYAILIDLPGCSHNDAHGIPTAAREYALEGRAIRATGESLKNCPQCGFTVPSSFRECDGCGYKWPRKEWKGPKIWNLELLEYVETEGDGDLTKAPKELKRKEWDRLVGVARDKSFGVGWAVREYKKQFEEDAPVKELPDEVKVKELKRLLHVQQSRGRKLGWISHAYKGTFGAFPSRALRSEAGVPLPPPKVFGRRTG